jgi:hypothetical protein
VRYGFNVAAPLRFVSITTAVATVLLAGCSSDDDSSDASVDTVTQVTDVATGEPPTPGSAPGGDSLPTPPGATLTGTQICERLAAASVAADLGLETTIAVPADSGTPQCAYEYPSGAGGTSNLTVAAMRPEDVGGASGEAAFDLVLEINRAVVGEGAEEQTINAGDNAVRLSSPALHVGIVQVGDGVYTLIVPAADAEPESIDQLIATMAAALR